MRIIILTFIFLSSLHNIYSQPDSISFSNFCNDTIYNKQLKMLPYWDYQKLRLLGSDSYTDFPDIYLNNNNLLTEYVIIDGIKLYNVDHLSFQSIENFYYTNNHRSIFLGNTIGDATAIKTKSISDSLWVSVSFQTFDLAEIEINMPFGRILNSKNKSIPTLYIASQIYNSVDPNQSYIKTPYVDTTTKVYNDLLKSPLLLPEPGSFAAILNAENVTNNDISYSKLKQNARFKSNSHLIKFFFPVTEKLLIKLGSYLEFENYNDFIYENTLFNSDNNTEVLSRNINSFASAKYDIIKETNTELSLNLSAVYSSFNLQKQDPVFKDNFFEYGYIGKFDISKVPSYEWTDTMAMFPSGVLMQNGFIDTHVDFTSGNGPASFYTEQYFSMYYPSIYCLNLDMIQLGGGLLNGQYPKSVYGIWNNIGYINDLYFKSNQNNIHIDISADYIINNHKITIGFQHQNQNNSYYILNPVGLWSIARNYMNYHILELDFVNPIYTWDSAGVMQDTIRYNRLYNQSLQSQFDKEFREHLNKPVDGTEWINIDAYDPDEFSLEYFSPDELLNSGNSFISYSGYDAYGNKINTKSYSDFFKDKNSKYETYNRYIPSFNPLYNAGFLSYSFKNKIVNISAGLRVDFYNANQPVIKDKYSIYRAYTAGELNGMSYEHPSNIQSDFVVYVDDPSSETPVILGYRDNDIWYNSEGIETDNPYKIAAATGITPYLVDPDANIRNSDFNFDDSFKDYQTKVNLLPIVNIDILTTKFLAFSFSFSSYAKNPLPTFIRFNPTDYLFSETTSYRNNSGLVPEIFNKISINAVIFNKRILVKPGYCQTHMENLVMYEYVYGAYPTNYWTLTNLDTSEMVHQLYIDIQTNNLLNIFTLNSNFSYYINNPKNKVFEYSPLSPEFTVNNFLTTDFTRLFKNSVLLHNTFRDLSLGIAHHFRKGLKYTSIEGIYLSNDKLNETKPSINYFDIKLNKNIMVFKNKAMLSFFVIVQNIFNKMNIYDVYPQTGKPDDDGYLTFPGNQIFIEAQNNPIAFRDQYSAYINNPYFYGNPRIVKLGLSINFH